MLCEQCGNKRAEIHLVKVLNGERHVQHLCRECAGEFLRMDGVANMMKMSFSLEGLMGIEEAFRELIMPTLQDGHSNKKISKHICPHCGSELPDSMFGPEPEADEKPRSEKKEREFATASENVAELEKKMREAVKLEDYEYAARLRDKISELKNKAKTDGEQAI